MHKKLSPLNEHNNNLNVHEIAFQTFKKLINVGLGVEISFDQFFRVFNLNDKTNLLALPCIVQKLIMFLNHKSNDIQTNVFSIHVGPLGEANIDAQFILNPYTIVVYYTFYLTKVNKFVTQDMQILLDKCKCEKT